MFRPGFSLLPRNHRSQRYMRAQAAKKPLRSTEVDPKSWTVENEIGTGRKHSEEKLFRVLFCLGK